MPRTEFFLSQCGGRAACNRLQLFSSRFVCLQVLCRQASPCSAGAAVCTTAAAAGCTWAGTQAAAYASGRLCGKALAEAGQGFAVR